MSENNSSLKWWQKSWVMWVCLILFMPVGIVLCYVNRERHPHWKVIMVVFGIMFLIGHIPTNSDNISQPTQQTQVGQSRADDKTDQEKYEEWIAWQEAEKEKEEKAELQKKYDDQKKYEEWIAWQKSEDEKNLQLKLKKDRRWKKSDKG